MSGQPVRKPSDIQAFRDAYLENLEMQDQINAENLEANKVYKATGALPPKSTITDTRTTSEILADVEGLKISLIASLKPLFDASTASQVLQRIQRSPLNKDGSLFTFFAQRVDEFVATLQKMYKYGIKGDENDIEQFVAFLEKSFSSTKTMSSTVRGYFDSAKTAQSTISQGEIDKYNKELELFKLNFVSKMYKGNMMSTTPVVSSFQSKELINEIRLFITEHMKLFTSEKYNRFIRTVSDTLSSFSNSNADASSRNLISSAYLRLQQYMKLLPNIGILNTLLIQLDKSLMNEESQLTDDIVIELYQMFPSFDMLEDVDAFIGKMQSFDQKTRTDLNQLDATANQTRQQPPPSQQQQPQQPQQPQQQLTDEEYADMSDEFVEKLYKIVMGNLRFSQDPFEKKNQEIYVDEIVDEAYQDYLRLLQEGSTPDEAKEITTTIVNEKLYDAFGHKIPADIIGQGLKKRRGRPKGCGIKKTFDDYKDLDAGVKSKTPFISFGKHFINNNKLQDGIISLRHKSGAGLPNLPSRKVSPNLSSIIKTIVGGGMPSYNDVDKLSDEEKNYLHQISKKSDLTQMLAIPSPSKDKMEKDFNQFEIMKGELMAGNDSKDLIKKFKVLLLKLVNTGQLPKQQVQEIMTELLEMGY